MPLDATASERIHTYAELNDEKAMPTKNAAAKASDAPITAEKHLVLRVTLYAISRRLSPRNIGNAERRGTSRKRALQRIPGDRGRGMRRGMPRGKRRSKDGCRDLFLGENRRVGGGGEGGERGNSFLCGSEIS